METDDVAVAAAVDGGDKSLHDAVDTSVLPRAANDAASENATSVDVASQTTDVVTNSSVNGSAQNGMHPAAASACTDDSSAAPPSAADSVSDAVKSDNAVSVLLAVEAAAVATQASAIADPLSATAPATAPASSPTRPANGTESAIPPKSRKFGSISAPRRLRSGSGSGSSTCGASTASVVLKRGARDRTGSGNSAGVAAGIVVGTIRRRHRASGLTRQGSSEDDGALAGVDATVAAATAVLKKPKSKRLLQQQPSLRNVATLVRSSIRQSLLDKAADSSNNSSSKSMNNSTTTDRDSSLERKGSATFANVAHQVVTSKRAAKGFLSMWAKDSTAVMHVYKGIHMEKKKLDLKTVASEYKELKRRQFYQELIVYVGFLTLFFSTLAWLPVHESYEQNDVVGALTCREHGVCELKRFSDIYDFATTLRAQLCPTADGGNGDGSTATAQWVRLGGVRFRQVRVQQQQCRIYNGWTTPCYPFYSPDVEERAPIVGQSGRVYTWRDALGPLQPALYGSVFALVAPLESYGTGGFAVDLCERDVSELQDDDWLGVATRALALEFTLVNPVTRVFTLGHHVFTMSPSGHLEHFAHSSHLRVIGLEQNELLSSDPNVNTADATSHASAIRYVVDAALAKLRGFDHRILLWMGLIAFLLTYGIGELTEMSTMGARTYLRSDMWNVFELLHLTLLAFLIVFMARFYLASSAYATDLGVIMRGEASEDADHSSAHALLRDFQRLADVASLASAVSLLKVFKFLRMNSTLNLLWRVLGMAMRDLMGFLVIFNLIFMGYSAMGSYAFGFALEEFSTIGKSYGTCFQMLAGEVDYARLSQANPRLAPVFIGTFVVLVFQILVNMFVAILSEYYESAKNDDGSEDVEYDVLTRVRNYLRACAPTVVCAKNEVVRLIPKQTVRLISTNLVDQEETRQRARKLFRGAVWRVVALLRFGMKFDRRIQFGDRKTHTPVGGAGGKDKDGIASHIRLSENFDHKTIKDMIPIGITICLKGDSLLGDGIALKVIRHNKLSVECVVLDTDDSSNTAALPGAPHHRRRPSPLNFRSLSASSSFDESNFDIDTAASPPSPRERVLELLGGEKLRIPWQIFAFHVVRSLFKEVRMGLLRAIKLWNYARPQLVDDYHLGLLFESVRADGRSSLRYDEVFRMLDLYLRQDKRKSLCTQAEVRQEALAVMYRFRNCLIDMPSREKEGHNYRPKPVDTSSVDLGQLEYLGDMLARNCHDMWALERLKQGWVYGAQRDDTAKKHPNLIPYKLLSPDEQAFDYRSSLETLKSIVFMNYAVVRVNHSHSGSFQDSLARSLSSISDSDVGSGSASGTSSASASSRALLLPSSSSVGVGAAGGGATESAPTSSATAPVSTAPASVPLSASTDIECASPPPAPESKGKKPVPTMLREAMSFRRNSLMEDSPYFTTYGPENNEVYRPLPIDTSSVDLPPRLLRLVDLLSENAHEVWAKGRMDEGWTYGPQRDDKAKKHPCLVPYIFLTDDEKEYDLNIAKETLKTLLAMKFTLVDRSSKY